MSAGFAHHRQGDVGDGLFVAGPEGLQVGDGAKLRETGDIGRIDALDMGDLMQARPQAVGLLRSLQPVERSANGTVADGVNMDLETRGIEGGLPPWAE